MDLSDKENPELEKRNMDYHSPNLVSEWQYNSHSNLSTQPLESTPTENSVDRSRGDLIGSNASSSVSMVNSFCPNIWDQPNSQNLGFYGNNLGTSTSSSSTLVIDKGIPQTSSIGMDKILNMDWNCSNSMMRGSSFLPSGVGMLPQSLSDFPTDSAFIERAARFSCFNGGNFGDIMNPFSISQSQNIFPKCGEPIQGPQDVGLDNRLEDRSRKEDVVKDCRIPADNGIIKGSPIKSDEPKDQAGRLFENEAEYSGGGGQGEASMLEGGEPSSVKKIGSKKRKRTGQNSELDEAKGASHLQGDPASNDGETKEKGDPKPSLSTGKGSAKDSLDTPKEDYIHVRARRGQATNSHSLAERVRREKISERMKLLQELVPGCNKVTGKAVMLDEIINYVQSLQRQVEFLSMKLAHVNPRLEFNIEGLLAKEMLQSRGGPSTLGFSPDMSAAHSQLHPSQQGFILAGGSMGNPSDVLRKNIDSQLSAINVGYKEITQIPNGWEDEIHNIIQMGAAASASFQGQDLNGSLQPGHLKSER
ncbi:hypothetical protein MKW94_030085 [Papaver nudicaule]|uniref:BHLH domain-containing protein n=1 Tax=Papaver nudicaule TaxID=74823 RepID=A0AA42B5J6_PAPNU|nr:hypothetical protein [Papaver nudicaule]